MSRDYTQQAVFQTTAADALPSQRCQCSKCNNSEWV